MSDIPLEIGVQAVRQLQQANEPFCFLDCRQVSEHQMARIEGTLLVPMNELPTRIDELGPFRSLRVVVHCHHGGRSHRVAQWLRENGFAQAQSMAGGIDAWATEIDPAVPRY